MQEENRENKEHLGHEEGRVLENEGHIDKRENSNEGPAKEPINTSEEKNEEPKEEPINEPKKEPKKEEPHTPKKPFSIKNFYDKEYKKLLIIPFTLLLLSIVYIAIHAATTGDFINRDVSLKGGITIAVPLEDTLDIILLEEKLASEFPGNDISVRSMKKGGAQIGVIIEADIDGTKKEVLDPFISSIGLNLNVDLEKIDYSVEIIGSSLGSSFFREAIIALLIAFAFMGIVVFLYFRTFVPSLAVILSAFSDIVVTLAIVNLIGLKLSTAGLAAFLMLIGYSVDTDILLSTKLLKRKEGTIFDRTLGALKTGLTMTGTTIAAVFVALMVTQSEVIGQIMLILLIGLLVDLINTWIQNAGILRWYLSKKNE